MGEHGLPIYLPRGITEVECQTALQYDTHDSVRKDVDFFHCEIAKQVQVGHSVFFPLLAICNLPKLWLLPVYIIPQVLRHPHLIFVSCGEALKSPWTARLHMR